MVSNEINFPICFLDQRPIKKGGGAQSLSGLHFLRANETRGNNMCTQLEFDYHGRQKGSVLCPIVWK